MLVLLLVAYDVNTETPEGRKRLRKVAKLCVAHGQQVQNSVFECSVDAATAAKLKATLSSAIDQSCDSLRFYNLGNQYNSRIEHIGAKLSYDAQSILIL